MTTTIPPLRSVAAVSVCTTMALLAGPAFAHDGPHQMTYLQSLLHELSHAGSLAAALAVAVPLAFAACGMQRRRAARAKL